MKIALEIERGYERGDIKQVLVNAADTIEFLLQEIEKQKEKP